MLTEAQLAALEETRTEKEAHGEFQAIVAPRIRSTSVIEGFGRVYQQTFIDTYCITARRPSRRPIC